jgi:hypothetical protein
MSSWIRKITKRTIWCSPFRYGQPKKHKTRLLKNCPRQSQCISRSVAACIPIALALGPLPLGRFFFLSPKSSLPFEIGKLDSDLNPATTNLNRSVATGQMKRRTLRLNV